jgi:predicted nucleic acid-binding protein
MSMILVDTNVLLDLVLEDPKWATWSQEQLEAASLKDRLAINPIIYAELSMAFSRIEDVEAILSEASLAIEHIPREALFLAGKVFLNYRKRSGTKQGVLPSSELTLRSRPVPYSPAMLAVTGATFLTCPS